MGNIDNIHMLKILNLFELLIWSLLGAKNISGYRGLFVSISKVWRDNDSNRAGKQFSRFVMQTHLAIDNFSIRSIQIHTQARDNMMWDYEGGAKREDLKHKLPWFKQKRRYSNLSLPVNHIADLVILSSNHGSHPRSLVASWCVATTQ